MSFVLFSATVYNFFQGFHNFSYPISGIHVILINEESEYHFHNTPISSIKLQVEGNTPKVADHNFHRQPSQNV